MAPANSSKRKADGPISPPPVKRKAQSSITKGAVASFFTPTSQKPREQTRTIWTERAPDEDTPATLLVALYEPAPDEKDDTKEKDGADDAPPDVKRRKIAAFDLDSTLITTASGKRHSDDPSDWKWWDASVPARLRQLYREENYRVVIISNQGGLTLHPDPSPSASRAAKAPKSLGGGGGDRVAKFKQKCAAVLAQLDVPTSVYAATGKDVYRKPRTGMWGEICGDYGVPASEVDLAASFFVGDAGGRTAQQAEGSSSSSSSRGSRGSRGSKKPVVAKDFSCSDRNFAHNVGIAYKTPEEFFRGEPPRAFARDFDLAAHPFSASASASTSPETDGTNATEKKDEKKEMKKEEEKKKSEQNDAGIAFERKNPQDLLLFVGPPGAGKSTFYRRHLQPLGYERVNQDALKSRARCLRAASDLLAEGKAVAVDNTNPDPDGRREWVELARKFGDGGVPVRCVWFKAPVGLCEHNDVVRALNKNMNPEARTVLPKLAFNTFFARFKEPDREKEGFQDVVEVDFRFQGTREEYEIWGRYWA